MITKNISYKAGGETCKGYLAYEEATDKKPLVMVVHAFEGCNDLAREYAEKIASLGYIGFAIDMYGEGRTSDNFEGCKKLFMALATNRGLVRERMVDTLAYARTIDNVDKNKIAAMGFCLGGMCCLDLARSGADIKGAVSFHGALDAPEGLSDHEIQASLLVMSGYEDPQVPPENITAFMNEMQNADVQFIFYNHTKHAFTDPDAHLIGPPEMGRVYNALSAQRAWGACVSFLKEVFS